MATGEEKLAAFLEELDRWISDGGDPAVPRKALGRPVDGTPYPLGRRAQYLRSRYRNGILPFSHAAELERRQGWAWDLRAHRWMQRYHRLVEHLERVGSYQGLSRAESVWATRAWDDLRAGQLSPSQVELVQRLPRRGGVELFVAAANSWLTQHPESTLAEISAGVAIEVDGRRYQLGRAIAYYRRRAAGAEGTHPLGEVDRALIEQIPGWVWEVTG